MNQSVSVDVSPLEARCKHWAKLIRAGQNLPMPSSVKGAGDIPGPYILDGDEELLPGDFLFEGESVHHRRVDRGWWYCLRFVNAEGKLVTLISGFGEQKAQLKAQGMSPDLLKGSGDIAAMVRIAHGVRLGMTVTA